MCETLYSGCFMSVFRKKKPTHATGGKTHDRKPGEGRWRAHMPTHCTIYFCKYVYLCSSYIHIAEVEQLGQGLLLFLTLKGRQRCQHDCRVAGAVRPVGVTHSGSQQEVGYDEVTVGDRIVECCIALNGNNTQNAQWKPVHEAAILVVYGSQTEAHFYTRLSLVFFSFCLIVILYCRKGISPLSIKWATLTLASDMLTTFSRMAFPISERAIRISSTWRGSDVFWLVIRNHSLAIVAMHVVCGKERREMGLSITTYFKTEIVYIFTMWFHTLAQESRYVSVHH